MQHVSQAKAIQRLMLQSAARDAEMDKGFVVKTQHTYNTQPAK